MVKMNEKQAKTLVSSLRRNLKDMDSTSMTHSQACELVAKSFGYRNWSTFRATFVESEPEPRSDAPALPNEYRLHNTGQFDFAKTGPMVHGYTFDSIQGTLEVIPNCLSYMTCVTREPSGELEVDFEGETKVNWDAQKPMLAEVTM